MPAPSTDRQIVTTLEQLKMLGPSWDRLATKFATPLLTHDWISAAAEALHSGDRLAVFIRREGDRIVAIAPLVERRRMGLRSLEPIGYSVLCEPSGVLYDRPAHLRNLLSDVAAHGLPVNFERVNDPILVAELTHFAGGTVRVVKNSETTIPWIRIRNSWPEYYASITPKWRSAHRRAIRKAEAKGPVACEFLSPGQSKFDGLMDLFIDVEGESWKARLGTALKMNVPLREFFRLYGRAASGRGTARFAFLRIGGTPVAAQFAVRHSGRHWLLKIGYDERFSHCSPGILLMHGALERAFSEGMASFEFLGSNEAWIQIWEHRLHRFYSRSIDRVAARRMLTGVLAFSDRVAQGIRTRLARSARGS